MSLQKYVDVVAISFIVLLLGGCALLSPPAGIENDNFDQNVISVVAQKDSLKFIAENYGDSGQYYWNFYSNQSFTKWWQLKNTGDVTWKGYRLVFVSGAQLNAPSFVLVLETKPGQVVKIEVPMKTPNMTGSGDGCKSVSGRKECQGFWQMTNSQNQKIGSPIWIKIGVDDTWGKLLDSFNGVTAYSNGTYSGTGNPLNMNTAQAGSGNDLGYGYLYQCVEYVKRFYNRKDWIGHGKDYWPTYKQKGLNRYPNGQTTTPPQPGDILAFSGGGFGHVSIVKEVTLPSGKKDGTVKAIQQNTGNATFTYTLKVASNGVYTMTGSSLQLQGWMRKP